MFSLLEDYNVTELSAITNGIGMSRSQALLQNNVPLDTNALLNCLLQQNTGRIPRYLYG